MNGKTIKTVERGSAAFKAGVLPGGRIVSMNGSAVNDVFDYGYLSKNCEVELLVEYGADTKACNTLKSYHISKEENEDMGLDFSEPLMDKGRGCANRCVFCFVDQNPKGMRETVYFKDDDWRLSFLTGNYITMTNMTDADFKRAAFYHISPLNISVHAIEADVRSRLMGNKQAGNIKGNLRRLKRAGISMNFQIVLCKGINDGIHLMRTIKALQHMASFGSSLSVVPVGLTAHRQGLTELLPFTTEDAQLVVKQVQDLSEIFAKKNEGRFVWCADEFYLKAGFSVPPYSYYEGFPQIENGVGMMAAFLREFEDELEEAAVPDTPRSVAVITGAAAYTFMEGLARRLANKAPGLKIRVIMAANSFFGESITVSGLLTGRDIIKSMQKPDTQKLDTEVFETLLIPENTLRKGEKVFLDGMTLDELPRLLNMEVKAVPVDGGAFVRAVFNINGGDDE